MLAPLTVTWQGSEPKNGLPHSATGRLLVFDGCLLEVAEMMIALAAAFRSIEERLVVISRD